MQDDIIFGFYYITCTEYMLAGKFLLDYLNLFSPKGYTKIDKIICKYFKDKYDKS